MTGFVSVTGVKLQHEVYQGPPAEETAYCLFDLVYLALQTTLMAFFGLSFCLTRCSSMLRRGQAECIMNDGKEWVRGLSSNWHLSPMGAITTEKDWIGLGFDLCKRSNYLHLQNRFVTYAPHTPVDHSSNNATLFAHCIPARQARGAGYF